MPNFDKIIEKTMRYKEYVNKEIVQITEKREMQKKSRSLSRNTKLNSQESIKKKRKKSTSCEIQSTAKPDKPRQNQQKTVKYLSLKEKQKNKENYAKKGNFNVRKNDKNQVGNKKK